MISEGTKSTGENGISTYSIPIKDTTVSKRLFSDITKKNVMGCDAFEFETIVINSDSMGNYGNLTHVVSTSGINISNNTNTNFNSNIYTTLTNLKTNTSTTVSTTTTTSGNSSSGTLGNSLGGNGSLFGTIWSGVTTVTNGIGNFFVNIFTVRKCKCGKSANYYGDDDDDIENEDQVSCCESSDNKNSSTNPDILTGSDNLDYKFYFNIPFPAELFETTATTKQALPDDDDDTSDCDCSLEDIDLSSPTTDTEIKKDAFECACTSGSAFGMQTFLELGFVETAWLAEAEQEEIRRQLCKFVKDNDYSLEAKNATKLTIQILAKGLLYGPYDDTYYEELNEFFDVDTTDPFFALRFSMQCAIVKAQNPDFKDWEVFLYVVMEGVHLGLDIIGLFPGLGEPADIINGGLYLLRGDNVNATLSFAGAVPFVGWGATGVKLVGKVVITAGGAKAVQIVIKNADEIAALATKLSDKFTVVIENGISVLKDKLGRVLARGDGDVARVLANVADAINDAQRSIMKEWKDNIATATNKQKGNFGEIGADLDLAEKGYIPLQKRIDDINANGHNGLDGVYEKNGQFFIVEGKYTGSASLNPANPATDLPRQMSDDWISQRNFERLREAVGDESADDIISSGYTRILAQVSPDSSVTYKLVGPDGYLNTGGGSWTP